MRPRSLSLVFPLILALLIAVRFPGVLIGNRSFFYRDFGVLAYPTVSYAHEAFWRGELPLWNPLSHCGVPFLAQWGTMVLYPGSLLYLLLPLPWSLNLFCLLHLWLAGSGMYLLARRWTGSDFAGGVAGLAFTFSGVTQSCLLWPNYTAALGWMPWVVWCGERVRRGGKRALVWAALAGTMQMLAGVPELVALTWLVVAGLSVLDLCRRHHTRSDERSPESGSAGRPRSPERRHVGRPALALALVLGLSAAQLLPFLQLLSHSQRDSGFAGTKWALPSWGLVNLVAPLFHCFQTTQGVFFEQGQEFLSSVYVGAGLVALAMLALVKRAHPRIWVLGALGVLGLALALGERSPPYHWLQSALPWASLARYPVKFVLLTSFVVPLLAAHGIRAWLEERNQEKVARRLRRQMCVVGMAVLGCIAASAWVAQVSPLAMDQPRATLLNAAARAAFLGALVAGLSWASQITHQRNRLLVLAGVAFTIWLDLVTHAPQQNPTLPSRLLARGLARPPQAPQPGSGRVFLSSEAEDRLLKSRAPSFEQDYVGKRLALWSNLNLLEDVAKVNGAATLRIREEAQVEETLRAANRVEVSCLEDFLGVALRTSPSNLVEWVSQPSRLPLVTAGQEGLFVEGGAELEALTSAGFDPRRTVILPRAARQRAERAGAWRAVEPRARVWNYHWSPHRLDFDIEASAPAWVVIAQTYYPAWHGYCENQPTMLWRANHAFQALRVPAGRSRVRLVYEDWAFRGGAVISLLTLIVCAGLWWSGANGVQCAGEPERC